MIRFITATIITAVALMCSMPTAAQANLDRLAQKFESSPNADVSYVEKRNPSTKQITNVNITIGLTDTQIRQVIEAIQKDRAKADSYTNIKGKGYQLKYSEGGYNSTYTLVLDTKANEKDVWMYVNMISPPLNLFKIEKKYNP